MSVIDNPAGSVRADSSDDRSSSPTDEEQERLRRETGLRGSVPAHSTVELPREVWNVARERDDVEEGLLDALIGLIDNQYRFTVDGEEVYRTDGYVAEE